MHFYLQHLKSEGLILKNHVKTSTNSKVYALNRDRPFPMLGCTCRDKVRRMGIDTAPIESDSIGMDTVLTFCLAVHHR